MASAQVLSSGIRHSPTADVRVMPRMCDRALLVDDPMFDQHIGASFHPERPERLAAARRAVETAAQSLEFERIAARDATDEELLRVHTPGYLETMGRLAGRWHELDPDTYLGPMSWAAARRAAGGTIALSEGLVSGRAPWGVALVRPPGHHARADAAMGFCLLNNVAVAAAHARALGVERVLIFDWDVHHGNGTQEIFYADPSVFYVSVHQAPYYPGTGAVTEVGSGEGRGYTANLPLAAGAGDAEYLAAWQRLVSPLAEAYRPELTLISAGFDAHASDPLGGMQVTDRGFRALAQSLWSLLASACPIGLVLEGGYDLAGLQGSLEGSFLGLQGGTPEPMGEPSARHAQAIDRARSELGAFWHLP